MPKINMFVLFEWNHITIPDTKVSAPIDPVSGQGL